jgi:hypothetical protein
MSMSKRARAKLVVTERALDPVATDQAAAIIGESGGDRQVATSFHRWRYWLPRQERKLPGFCDGSVSTRGRPVTSRSTGDLESDGRQFGQQKRDELSIPLLTRASH